MAQPVTDPEFRRRAHLAQMRQTLLAPVRAILGYQEIVFEDAERLGLHDTLEDLGRIRAAASSLDALVDRLLDFGGLPESGPSGDTGEVEAKLRHDLRTPLNAIIGYSEIVLEDLGELAASAMRSDLEKLLDEARQLLGLIDVIVDFSQREKEAARLDSDEAEEAIVAGLQRAIRRDSGTVAAPEPGRILVVDDNESNRELLRRRLVHEGHAVVVAGSGRHALEILDGATFDVILLDLMMPDMNGLELLQRLRSDERHRQSPVIMISGLNDTEAVVRCIEAGAEDYLSKPFNPVLLRARINACLERKRWQDRERQYLHRIETEKERADALLRNILPGQIVARLNDGETVIADRFQDVTILFADLVGFTPAAARMPPARLVERLNRIFTAFDALVHRFGVEKIKTIGDAYMAAAGVPEARADHALAMAELGFGMLEEMRRIEIATDPPFQIRIGMHTGPAIAGVIGQHKFIYDIWGDTVNIASRLETHGVADRIQVSDATRRALGDRYGFEPRGMVDLRGMGRISAFLLTR